MKIINQSYEIISKIDREDAYRIIECAGRVCYKSEDKIENGSAEKFIRNIIKRGHESVLEHYHITVKFITDRGISHQIVRHRIGAYSQESTCYCNYTQDKFENEIIVVEPCTSDIEFLGLLEKKYFDLINQGKRPGDARDVLPTCLKTELVATYNIRQWRHIFKLRRDKHAHPKIQKLMNMVFKDFKVLLPVFFEDLDNVSKDVEIKHKNIIKQEEVKIMSIKKLINETYEDYKNRLIAEDKREIDEVLKENYAEIEVLKEKVKEEIKKLDNIIMPENVKIDMNNIDLYYFDDTIKVSVSKESVYISDNNYCHFEVDDNELELYSKFFVILNIYKEELKVIAKKYTALVPF